MAQLGTGRQGRISPALLFHRRGGRRRGPGSAPPAPVPWSTSLFDCHSRSLLPAMEKATRSFFRAAIQGVP